MQLIQTSSEGLKRAFKVVVPAGTISEKVDAKLVQIGRTARLPGFRPGKTPMAVLRQRYAKSVLGEVLEDAVQESTGKAIADNNLRPAMQPKVEDLSFAEGKDLEFTLSLEIVPEMPAIEFGKIAIERPKAPVDDAAIDAALRRLADRMSQTEPMTEDRGAQTGDTAVIDFGGSIDGEPIKGGSGEDFHLTLGSNSFVPGFEDAIVGARTGDNLIFNVTFPDNYHAELAGKEAAFSVRVKELRQPAQAKIDDELAKGYGFDDLAAMREAVKAQIDREYGAASRAAAKRVLLDKLADDYPFEVPSGMLDLEFDAIWKQIEDAREKGSLDEEDKAKSEEQLRTDYRAVSERRVRLGLLLADVGQRNNITVTQDEINRAVMAEASRFPGQEKLVMEYYRKTPGALDSLKAPLFEEKVVDFILEMAQITDKSVSAEELLGGEAGAKE